MLKNFGFAASLIGLTLAVAALAQSSPAFADPPERVARLSFVSGNVSFAPAGENAWVDASINRPIVTGDRLWSDQDARAELQIGAAVLRLDGDTSFNFLNLDDRTAQIELTQGTLNLRVRSLAPDQVYEVDTPTLAFTVSRPGEFRIDVDPKGGSTSIAVFSGAGNVYGEGGAQYAVDAGRASRFFDAQLHDYEVVDLPPTDDFDHFCFDRDDRQSNSPSLRYVSDDVVGYADLDNYGNWNNVADYGAVWFPTRVNAGWAPYRDGHWAWIDPWGWTWVDNAPWGFAPSHYGRWAYMSNRWGWIPGPRSIRPVYAPALVAFVGGNNFGVSVGLGGGAPVGWFPLGPREAYYPSYRVSRNYFTQVNVSNTVITNINITNNYNNYSAGRPIGQQNWANRNAPNALTAVPRNVFTNGRPVGNAALRINRDAAARGEVMRMSGVTPVAASVMGGRGRAGSAPPAAVFGRQVVARTAPPPAPLSFSARQGAIERNGGRPLPTEEIKSLRAAQPRGQSAERVRVVQPNSTQQPRALPAPTNTARGAAAGRTGTQAPVRGAVTPAERAGTPVPSERGQQVNRREPNAAAGGPRAPINRAETPRAEQALPSSRFRTPPAEGGGSNASAPRARAPERNAPAERGAPINRAAPPARATPIERVTPAERARPAERAAPRERAAPIQRAAPVERAAPFERAAPVERAAPRERVAPIQRAAPVERATPFERAAPVERAAPRERAAPIQRAAPVERAAPRERAAPIQRAEPVQRAAPMERAAPPERVAPANREVAPQNRRAAPPPREQRKKDEKDRNDDGRH